MTSIQNLKGFSYPLTPNGVSSIVGDMPWHYATEYLTIIYRTDPNALMQYLPEPLEPGPEPGVAYVAFSRWWSLWDNQPEMAFTNPERTQYREAAIWVGCAYQGAPAQTCLHIWVDNDFTLARGWFMGFPKKLGQSYMTEYHPLNPAMEPLGPGSRLKGFVCAHGERLIEGTMQIERPIQASELPPPIGLPIYNLRQFPSVLRGAPASVLELVRLGAENVRYGEAAWAGRGTLQFFPSEIEEHGLLAPREVIAAFRYSCGYSFPGGEVLYRWARSA
jgi:acetoacetate decarboxylase